MPDLGADTLSSFDYVITLSGSQTIAKPTNPANSSYSGSDAGAVLNSVITVLSSGGSIFVGPGTFNCTTGITMQNYIKLVGSGMVTIIKAANSSNIDVIKTSNFASLTGTNSTGGIHSFDIESLVIDGNKANNSSGYGLRIYGYGYRINDVIIQNCKTECFYSEWSTSTSPPSPHSMEAHIDKLMCHTSDGLCFRFRGPHDSHINNLICYEGTGGVGAFESGANYDAGCHIGKAHFWGPYTTTAPVVDVVGTFLYTENLMAEGASGAGGKGIYAHSGSLIHGRVTTFANETGLVLESQVNNVECFSFLNGTGVVINSAYNRLSGLIWDNTTYGLQISRDFTGLIGLTVDVKLRTNATHLRFEEALASCKIRAHIFTVGGETALSGSPSLTANDIEIYSAGAGTNYNIKTPLSTLGDILYRDASANARLAGNTTATKKFLTQTGTGAVSAAPGWNTIVDGDLPTSMAGKTLTTSTLTTPTITDPASSITIGTATAFPSLIPALGNKKWGTFVGLGSTQSDGIMGANATLINVGTGASGGVVRGSTGLNHNYTTGGTQNSLGGIRHNSTAFTQRDLNPWVQWKLILAQTANTRVYFGFTSSTAAPASAADPLANLSGVGFFYDAGVDGNWHIAQNSGGASSDRTTIANVAAADTSFHTFALRADNANTKFQYSYGGAAWVDINTTIPAATTGLGMLAYIENLTGSTLNFSINYIQVLQDA